MKDIGDFSEVEVLELHRIADRISASTDLANVQRIQAQNSNTENPLYYQCLGIWFIQHGYHKLAIASFEKGATFGLQFPNRYWNTSFADSVGQCFFFITDYYDKHEYNMFVLAYAYLSNCACLWPRRAFESLRSRATLLLNSPHTDGFIMRYDRIGLIKEPLVISDFYFAGFEYNHDPDIKIQCLTKANKLHRNLEDISVSGKGADTYSIRDMSIIGEARHARIYEAILPDIKSNLIASNVPL